MIVTNVTKDVQIPHEPGESATIRRLSHRQLRQAAKAREKEGIGWLREVGPELVKALRDGDAAGIQKIEEAQAANVNNYDRDQLLAAGLVAWTYPEPVTAIADLDEDTAAFLAQAIFDFARKRTAAETKNA